MPPEDENDQNDNDPGDEGQGTGDGPGSGSGAGDQGKLLAQADVDRIVKRERSAAERKARQQLADELGISIDEAKKLIEDRKAADESQKTEAQRATEAANAAKAQAEAAVRQARQTRIGYELRAALLDGTDEEPGIRRDRMDMALEMVLPTLADVDDEGLGDAVREAVATFRGKVPEFFGPAGSNGSGSNGNGQGTPPGPGRKIGERAGDGAGVKSRAQQDFEILQSRHKLKELPKL
jgi:multidrug efflux pump subunit AcrA (membrane-fusion protein)